MNSTIRAISQAIYAARPGDAQLTEKGERAYYWRAGCNSAREVTARKIADALQRTEPGFSRAQFLADCGVAE